MTTLPPPPQVHRVTVTRPSVHAAINRWLASVALLLSIAALAVFLFAAWRVHSLVDRFGDSPPETGTVDQYGPPMDVVPPDECWDPGSGTVCAPGGEDGM